MREHKFRACIPSINKVCFDGKGMSLRRIWRLDESYFNSDVVWLEWTGLKDSKGVEIYEGDIIKGDKHNYPHKIIYTLGSFKGKQVRGKFKGYVDGMFFDRFEVIGNIYENKELLK